jgi:hypothetical protein
MRFVEQRSRSQLNKIEQKLDTCFVSARYLKNKMSDVKRIPPLTTWHVCTKFHLDQTFHS